MFLQPNGADLDPFPDPACGACMRSTTLADRYGCTVIVPIIPREKWGRQKYG
jgi:hypothetical protein